MNIKIANGYLHLHWWSLLPFLAVFSVLLALGVWQLSRAEARQQWHERSLAVQDATAVNFLQLEDDLKDALWRRVQITGRFDNRFRLLLDNQSMHGQVGYFVLTPFLPAGSDHWILVNQGWVPLGENRDSVPNLLASSGSVSLEGVIKPKTTTGIVLGEASYESMVDGVYRIQAVDIDALSSWMEKRMRPVVIRLLASSAYGYQRDWYQPGSGSARNLSYAVQWFLLATAALIIYLRLSWRTRAEVTPYD